MRVGSEILKVLQLSENGVANITQSILADVCFFSISSFFRTDLAENVSGDSAFRISRNVDNVCSKLDVPGPE